MTEKTFQLALLQQECGPDPDAGLTRAVERVHAAAEAGARLVVLPELFRSRYFCQAEDPAAFDLAEPVPGPATEALAAVARERQVVVVAGLFERRAPGLHHNTAVILDADGRVAGRYRKMHIPDDPQFHEKFYFAPGDGGFPAFDTAVGRIAVLICWDQWYPEAARLAALSGARLLLYPTAIGWLPRERDDQGDTQLDAWRTAQRAHAIANGVWVAAVNRVGHEESAAGGITFWGHSFVCDPLGTVVAEAGENESVVTASIDPARVESVRRDWPFLRDRRIDAYGGLDRRYLDS